MVETVRGVRVSIRTSEKDNEMNGDEDVWGKGHRYADLFKQVIGSCGGFADVTSYFTRGSARKKSTGEDYDDGGFLITGRKMARASRKKQATLEIPNAGFDDDVSALSDNTLQEMERLRHLRRLRKMQDLSPTVEKAPSTSKQASDNAHPASSNEWMRKVPRQNSNTELSIGVSTSGSASTEDEPHDEKWTRFRNRM